jgi:hypothetical protein
LQIVFAFQFQKGNANHHYDENSHEKLSRFPLRLIFKQEKQSIFVWFDEKIRTFECFNDIGY